MTTTKPTYSKQYNIDYFHVDLNNRVKLSSLFNYMQDIAGIHANILGCGYDVLVKLDITWIMLRAKIEMKDYPNWGEEITVETYTNGVEKLCAVREFNFYNKNGENIGHAITYWILYDIVGQKVVRINHGGFSLPEHLTKSYGDYEKLTRIKDKGELVSQTLRQAHYNEIDTNIHVNNARYIEWMTDAIYEKDDDTRIIKYLHIGFTSSVKLGDIVNIKKFLHADNDKTVVLTVEKDDAEYVQAEIEFV